MKLCPNCKAELDDNARFCLCCMTSLDEKEQIPPPVLRSRRWPLVLLCLLLFSALTFIIVFLIFAPDKAPLPSAPDTATAATVPHSKLTQEIDGVRYTFRPATQEDHPSAIRLDNYYVLIQVEGSPSNGIYKIPAFVGDDTQSLVTVVADGAFAGTNARKIDLGYNVRYVWGNAFGGYPLADLYLHGDVLIDRTAFSGCTTEFSIHGPDYLENTQGVLWSELSVTYGFRWQPEAI